MTPDVNGHQKKRESKERHHRVSVLDEQTQSLSVDVMPPCCHAPSSQHFERLVLLLVFLFYLYRDYFFPPIAHIHNSTIYIWPAMQVGDGPLLNADDEWKRAVRSLLMVLSLSLSLMIRRCDEGRLCFLLILNLRHKENSPTNLTYAKNKPTKNTLRAPFPSPGMCTFVLHRTHKPNNEISPARDIPSLSLSSLVRRWQTALRGAGGHGLPSSRGTRTSSLVTRLSLPLVAGLTVIISCAAKLTYRRLRRAARLQERCVVVRDMLCVLHDWEDIVLSEVSACLEQGCCLLATEEGALPGLLGPENYRLLRALWRTHRHPANPSSASGFLSRAYLHLSLCARKTVWLREDVLVLQRLDVVIQYGLFRRLCLIGEARYLRSLLVGEPDDRENALSSSAWRMCGGPSWLLPCTPPGHVEEGGTQTLMTHTTPWLYQPALEALVATWAGSSHRALTALCRDELPLGAPLPLAGCHCREWGKYTNNRIVWPQDRRLLKEQTNRVSRGVKRMWADQLFGPQGRRRHPHMRTTVALYGVCASLSTVLRFLSESALLSQLTLSLPVSLSLLEKKHVLRMVSRHVCWSLFTGACTVVAHRFKVRTSQRLRDALTENVKDRLVDAFLTADDAVADRFLSATEVSLEQLALEGPFAMMEMLEDRVRQCSRAALQLSRVWYYRDYSAACAAAALPLGTLLYQHLSRCFPALLQALRTAEADTAFTTPMEVLPLPPRFGLSLVIEVLADRMAERGPTAPVADQHAILGLLACSCHAWQHRYNTPSGTTEGTEGSLWDTMEVEKAEQLLAQAQRVERVYAALSSLPIKTVDPTARMTIYLESMQVTTTHLLQSSVSPSVQRLSAVLQRSRQRTSVKGGSTRADRAPPYVQRHPRDLDQEEHRIAADPAKLSLFPKQYPRSMFLFKQLGLESLAAFRWFQHWEEQRNAQHTSNRFMADVVQLVSGLVDQCVNISQAALLVALASTQIQLRDRDGRWAMPPLVQVDHSRAPQLLQLYRHMVLYKEEILAATREDARRPTLTMLLPLFEVLQELPCSISDRSRWSTRAELVERRKQWRPLTPKSFSFDAYHRITGGLCLQRGIQLQHVTFLYPLFQRSSADSGDAAAAPGPDMHVRPILRDACLSLPSRGLTGVTGRTGVGKSTLFQLLRRVYDPIPVLRCTDAHHGPQDWSHAVLQHVVERHLVSSAVPLPPASLAIPSASSLDDGENLCCALEHPFSCITMDGIPLGCFSTAYLRQWLVQMEQSPTVLAGETCLENVRALRPDVRRTDIETAISASCSTNFLCCRKGERPPLSGGELQRLSLARTLAAAVAQSRRTRMAQSWYEAQAYSDGAAMVGVLLDEPTSQLDAETELLVERRIARLAGCGNLSPRVELTAAADRDEAEEEEAAAMVVVVTHRLSSLRHASHLVVLDDHGGVEKEGPPGVVFQTSASSRPVESLFRTRTRPRSHHLPLNGVGGAVPLPDIKYPIHCASPICCCAFSQGYGERMVERAVGRQKNDRQTPRTLPPTNTHKKKRKEKKKKLEEDERAQTVQVKEAIRTCLLLLRRCISASSSFLSFYMRFKCPVHAVCENNNNNLSSTKRSKGKGY
eukprot:gene10638-7386_t